MQAFIDAGLTRANMLELVTIIDTNTISNDTTPLTHTPHESFMADPSLTWVAPERRVLAPAAA